MAKNKIATISDKDACREVSKRTGLPLRSVEQIILAYYSVIQQCVESEVRVKTGLGIFSWNERKPRHNATYRNPRSGEIIKNADVPGYRIPKFTPRKKWKESLKEKTRIEWNEREESE